MDTEQLKQKLDELNKQQELTWANLHRINGAIALLSGLIQEQEKQEKQEPEAKKAIENVD